MLSEPVVVATVVCVVIVLAITTLASLASLWAANTAACWTARAAPIGLFLGMQFPIGCFDFAFVFAAQALLVVGAFSLARVVVARRNRRKPVEPSENVTLVPDRSTGRTPRFTLARMFLAFLLSGVAFGMIAYAPD